MRKAIAGIAIIIVLVVGGILIFHKSPNSTINNNAPPSSNTANQTSASVVNNSVLLTKTSPSLGQYLTDPSGRALYTYNADTSGVSNCTGSCLVSWPAYQDKGTTTGLPSGINTIKRTDNGQIQYTYNGMPLYYFANDSGTQVTGNGVENFSVATPAATTSNSTNSNNSSSGYPY